MVLCDTHIKLGVTRIAVGLIGVGRFPLVMAEVRLRERDKHSDVVSSSQNFLEAKMCARFTAVVVSIDKIDPDALEPIETFSRTVVSRQRRADLRVVEWHSGKKNA